MADTTVPVTVAIDDNARTWMVEYVNSDRVWIEPDLLEVLIACVRLAAPAT